MGMDAGAAAGKREAVIRDKAFAERWKDGVHLIRDPGMPVRQFLALAGLLGRLGVLVFGEKILPAGFLGVLRLGSEPVHEVEAGAGRRQGIGRAADEQGEQAVGFKLPDPQGNTGKFQHCHKGEGADNLHLVFSGPTGCGVEAGKIFHGGFKVKQAQFFPCGCEFAMEPCAL